jgi:hypothetical protein
MNINNDIDDSLNMMVRNNTNDTNDTNDNTNDCIEYQTDHREKKIIGLIQLFTVSSIGMLNLLQTVCCRTQSDVNYSLQDKEIRSMVKFIESSNRFVKSVRETSEDNFDYTRFVKKSFKTLKPEAQCLQLRSKDSELFNVRDEDNKIVTILPGLDLRCGYKYLNESENKLFWQYMYLFSSSVFNLIRNSNVTRFEKYHHIVETLDFIENDIAKTGIMFNNQIFNPFMGVVGSDENRMNNYSVEEMFTGGELPKQQNISIESVLSMMGVDKIFNESKLNEELKNIGDDQINDATAKIVGLLGAANNPEVKEVCNALIQDIVNNFKENGINNVGDTLKRVAENAKKNIAISKMEKTAESMKFFMTNSQENMKNMKDAKGNPIGQQIMNSMSFPMSMMNMLQKPSTENNRPNINNNDK